MQTATVLCFTAILNRFFLFIFGGEYWIYGYMVIYIFYGVVLTLAIGTKRFPFKDTLMEVQSKDKKTKKNYTDLAEVPEFVLILVTVIMIILFVIMAAVRPIGVPLGALRIGNNTF